jgi:hypothetical protein
MIINGTLRSRVKRDTMIVNVAFEGGGVKEQEAEAGSQVHRCSSATIFDAGSKQEI